MQITPYIVFGGLGAGLAGARSPVMEPVSRITLRRQGLWLILLVAGLCSACGPSWDSVGGGSGARSLLVIAAGLALACLVVKPLQQARFWVALALLSQAAWLQIIEAGPHARYQRLLRPAELSDPQHLPSLLLLAGQGLLVAWALRGHIRDIGRVVRHHMPRGLWLIVLGALFLSSANELWKTRSQWLIELAMAGTLATVQLGNLIAIGQKLPEGLADRLSAWVNGDGKRPKFFNRYAIMLAVAATVFAFILGGIAYDWYPHIPDENVYFFHARYLAESQLYVRPPAVPEAFTMDLMLFEAERLYSPVPIGWPALLSLGVRLGIPWLVNPILAGGAVLLLHALVVEVYDVRRARWAALLLASSPWFLFVSMTLMTHNASLFFALIAALSVARMRNGTSMSWALLAGVAIGCVSLIRPLEGAIVAALLGPWCLLQRGQPLMKLLLRSGIMTAVTALVGLLVAPYNQALTGKPFYFPIMAYVDRLYAPGANDIGFGPNRGMGWVGLDPRHGHDLRDMALNTDLNVFAVNTELMGWAAGSIVLLGLVIFSRRVKVPDLWMAAAVGAVSGVHGLYWFAGGPDFGARYWFLVIAPCVVLAVRGVDALAESCDEIVARSTSRVWATAFIASVIAALVFIPWRVVDKYRDYRGVLAQFEDLVEDRGMQDGLLLIYGRQDPDYSPAATLNPTDFSGPGTIVAWDRAVGTSTRVVDSFGPRKVWLIEGPTVSDSKLYEVAAGPLDSDDAKDTLRRLWKTRKPTEVPDHERD